MGTAEWTGVRIAQLVNPKDLPEGVTEMAVIGTDGHGDSFPESYAWQDEPLLALGMNGRTLNRQHGFPVRLLVPRYYGFKNIKWIGEIAFVRQPYFGTWPRMGYTKQPLIHTCSFVDRIRRAGSRVQAGGASFAGVRGIRRVDVRAGGGGVWGPWQEAVLEEPLSPYTLTRWIAELEPPRGAEWLEARAQDNAGQWQSSTERPLFPDGIAGPTLRRIPS
jgi:DMSO/TMAO reductase YedYZ molybdopterin-dependent catalytic subunit